MARRILFYIPGYDPDAERRYRVLFVREIRRYAKIFGIAPPKVSRSVVSQDGISEGWTVDAKDREVSTRTDYEVLLWSDLVRRDMAKPYLAGLCLNAWAMLNAAVDGTLRRLYRASWKCANVIVYPFVLSLILLLVMLAAVALGHGVLKHDILGIGLGLPAWLALLTGAVAVAWGGKAVAPRLDRIFFWQLMHDWSFHWQHAAGRRPDYRERLDAFADHVLSRIRQSEYDEILIVGHSTGGLTAVELVTRLLEREPRLGCEGPVLSLLTLGSSLPIVALQPAAHATRAEVGRLIASRRLVWVDFQAPQDWMNFPGFNPIRDLSLDVPEDAAANPIIRSAKFKELIDAQIYRDIRLRPFRMHFQFLMANDRAGVFDYFALTLGSRCLRERVLGNHGEPLGSA